MNPLFLIGGLVVGAIFGLGLYSLNAKKEREKELFQNLKLTTKNANGEIKYPVFERTKNKIILKKYNPAITKNDFNTEALMALSKVFSKGEDDNFVMAEYERASFFQHHILNQNKNRLVLYNSNIKQTDFYKDWPNTKQYEFWVGRDIKHKNVIYSIKNKTSFAIYGKTGLGKSTLANVILTSLSKDIRDEFIFTKSRQDYLKGPHTNFYSKDNEPQMLEVMKALKKDVLERQKLLDVQGKQNIFQLNEKVRVLLMDECHTYLRQDPSLSKEEKETRTEIISLAKFFLNQTRSVGIVTIFILPSAEAQAIDVPTRDCHYIFSSKIPSELVSQNIFRTNLASLIPAKYGLFICSDESETRLIQVANIKRDHT